MHHRRLLAALLVSALPAAAQDAPRLLGRSFFPAEHSLAAFVDMQALVESDFFDALERSPARLLLERFAKSFGFRLDDVARIDFAMRFHPDAEDHRRRQSVAVVLKGNERVGLAELDVELLGGRYEVTKVGDYEVWTGQDPAIVSPRPGLCVFGDEHHLLGIVGGEVRGGVPTPELMPLISGGKALAYFAMLVGEDDSSLPIPDAWTDGGDPVRSVAMRLERRAADGHLVFKARAGFETGASGPALMAGHIDEALKQVAEQAEFVFLRPVLAGLDKRIDGRELLVELDLGEEGRAMPLLVQTVGLGLLMPMKVAAEQARAAEARAVEVQAVAQRLRKAQERVRKAVEEEGKKKDRDGRR